MFISLRQSCWTTLEIISRRAIAVINSKQALKTQGIYSLPSEPSASLLAEVNPVTYSQYLLERNVLPINFVGGRSRINYISKTGDELSVWSNNVPELTGFFSETAQLGISKINSNETSTGQIGYSGINSSQIIVQKPGTLEKTRLDVGIPQVTVTKFSPNQITTSQIDTAQVDIAKFSTSNIDKLQFNPTQVSVLQNEALKISLPNSIKSQKLFSIHIINQR